ncbi:hypothetical protein Taro_050721 [Colocasia esculenta]|uniref:Uncharacterized protein n=1 Tax=Colocasia esculenta TaxID=4460 RepID=A0A843XE44_COLES|nr:hypothetical protein [Colocasia esculenta]
MCLQEENEFQHNMPIFHRISAIRYGSIRTVPRRIRDCSVINLCAGPAVVLAPPLLRARPSYDSTLLLLLLLLGSVASEYRSGVLVQDHPCCASPESSGKLKIRNPFSLVGSGFPWSGRGLSDGPRILLAFGG